MRVIIAYVFSVYVFCFGQIFCLVCAINVRAVAIQNLTAMTMLTGKMKVPTSAQQTRQSTTLLMEQRTRKPRSSLEMHAVLDTRSIQRA